MMILLAEEVKQVVSEELLAWIEKQPDLRLRLRQAIGKIPGEPLSKQHQLIVGFLAVCRSENTIPKFAAFCGKSGARGPDLGLKLCLSGVSLSNIMFSPTAC